MIRFESEITVLQDNTLDTSHPPWSIELQGEVCGMPNLHRGTDLKTIYIFLCIHATKRGTDCYIRVYVSVPRCTHTHHFPSEAPIAINIHMAI